MDCLTNFSHPCANTDIGTQLFAHLLNTLILSQISLYQKSQYPPDKSNNYLAEYDFIIVGAGSAGCPLAASLVSNPNWNVLLIEAGDDPQPASEIPLLFFTVQKTYQDWQYLTVPQKRGCQAFNNRQCAWPRAKLLGGCSAINAMIYNMGNPRDYDEWERMGNVGWGWQHVEKYFKNHFKISDLNATLHINDTFAKTREAILEIGQELGLENIHDPFEKSQGTVGCYKTPAVVENAERINAARIYLKPIANKTNFHVIKNGHVTKVLIDKTTKHAYGVQVYLNNQFVDIRATKEVILSAGTTNTPQILMLSGIGPEKHLRSLQIKPIQNLPVGDHLMDHVNFVVVLSIYQNSSDSGSGSSVNEQLYDYFIQQKCPVTFFPPLTNVAMYINPKDPTSRVGEVSFHHLYITKDNPSLAANPLNMNNEFLQYLGEPTDKIVMYINLLRPKSEGTIRLKSNDPFTAPIIDPNYYSHPDDIKMLLYGYRHLQKFLKTNAFKSLRAKMIEFDFDACKHLEYDSDEYCICLIEQTTSTIYHPVGTVRMGIGNDSVVDPRLRVKGIKGLRVADGSILPRIVGGNTHASITMVGEKAADMIKEDWLQQRHTNL